MGALSHETYIVQNPALGAMLLWSFTTGYERGSKVSAPPPLPLLFIVLPLTLHQETSHLITSTQRRSGLRAFVNKFSDSKVSKNDLILAVNERAIQLRKLSMNSLRLAVASRLVAIDASAGSAISLSSTAPRAGIPRSVRAMLQNAEKLGRWFSEVSLHEVSVILKVRF